VGVSKRVAANWFVYFNPFFRDATGGPGSGTVTVVVEGLKMPLNGSSWKTVGASGRVKAQNVKLARVDEMRDNDERPANLASQLALVSGDSMESVLFNADGRFTIADGDVKSDGTGASVGPMKLVMAGRTDLDNGAVEMRARVSAGSAPGPGGSASAASLVGELAKAGAVFAIKGTVWQPQLVIGSPGNVPDATARMLSEQVFEQMNKLRAKEAQRQMLKSQQEIDQLLKPLRGMDQKHRSATQATTGPATTPK
jgi:hypothetical protein